MLREATEALKQLAQFPFPDLSSSFSDGGGTDIRFHLLSARSQWQLVHTRLLAVRALLTALDDAASYITTPIRQLITKEDESDEEGAEDSDEEENSDECEED